jgi:hypothetical protein
VPVSIPASWRICQTVRAATLIAEQEWFAVEASICSFRSTTQLCVPRRLLDAPVEHP